MYQLISAGAISTVHVGRRCLITTAPGEFIRRLVNDTSEETLDE
jgi:hypothetical protein